MNPNELINIVEENVPEVGGWSGTCKCPNGEEYKVGDYHNACASIACIGGVSSGCNRNDRTGLNRRVTCAQNKVEENVPVLADGAELVNVLMVKLTK